jgi:hypothetical protein
VAAIQSRRGENEKSCVGVGVGGGGGEREIRKHFYRLIRVGFWVETFF